MKNKELKEEIVNYHQYENAIDFLDEISYGGNFYKKLIKNKVAFRGHKSASFELVPTVLRDNFNGLRTNKQQCEYEFYILNRFYAICDQQGLPVPDVKRFRRGIFSGFDDLFNNGPKEWLPEDLYDIAALAQHYGQPTRLLDWTYNINTAIYFAIIDYIKNMSLCDAEDFITIWAMPISYGAVSGMVRDYPDFPLKLIRPIYKYNPNLRAQQGLFTLLKLKLTTSNLNENKVVEPLDVIFKNHEPKTKYARQLSLHCFKIRNRFDNIIHLREYISKNYIDTAALFPGYKGVSDLLNEDCSKFLKRFLEANSEENVIS